MSIICFECADKVTNFKTYDEARQFFKNRCEK